jgi:HSP20 family protein
MVSRFLTPFGGRSQPEAENTFLELPHELNQRTDDKSGGRSMRTPRLDVYEGDGLIEMTAELPGVADSDIEVSLDGDILTISGEKRDRHEGKKVHFAERSYGGFRRSIQLPFAPEPDRMEASSENGVLTISFPRVEPDQTHRIPVRGARGVEREESGGSRRAIGRRWSQSAETAEQAERSGEQAGDDELKLSEEQAIHGEGAPA